MKKQFSIAQNQVSIQTSLISPDRFVSQNLYQGAFCLCQGLKLSGKINDGKKVTIIFEGKAAQEKAMAFYNGARVEAKSYSDAYRSLKDYVFER